jgi:hypothetical protein
MASLVHPPRPSAAGLLRQLALAPAAPAVLTLGWLGLALTCSQLPAADSVTTDGLGHADLLGLAALGLDRPFASVPALLWLAATLVVLVARRLEPRSARGVPAVAAPEGALAGLRVRAGGGQLVVGRLGLGRALLAAAAVSGGAAWTLQARAPRRVWLEIAPGGTPGRLPAWQRDAGTWAPAAGRWAGACRAEGPLPAQQLTCELETPHGPIRARLRPGQTEGGLTWQERASGWDAGEFLLDWRSAHGPVLLRLKSGEPGQSTALGLQVSATSTATAGPIVAAVHGERELTLLASPGLAPKGSPQRATVRGAERVHLVWRPPSVARWLWLAAWLLLLPGALWAWLVPGAEVVRTEAGEWRLLACNRPRLRALLELRR